MPPPSLSSSSTSPSLSSTESAPTRVLTINGGSSSIKFAAFERVADGQPRRRLGGEVERVGTAQAVLRPADGAGSGAGAGAGAAQPVSGGDVAAAVGALVGLLGEHSAAPAGVVHRVVHGGTRYFDPQRVDDALLGELRQLAALDPAHLPGEIELMEVVGRHYPGVPQFACFDTAFHRDLPAVARVLPIPRRLTDAGIRRFGFHGLSYQYLMLKLAEVAGAPAAGGRVILAHLGSGASMAAVRQGKCIDTTMSFTPTAGLVMGTRCGDLDPGLLVYLMRSQQMSVEQIDAMINRESGLKGISGGNSDMRDLLQRRGDDANAALAVDLFCYQAKKFVGALAAALGGVETLVFSAGIGEHVPAVRAQICEGLKFLGIELDAPANQNNAGVISRAGSAVSVRVIPTDEELTLARAAFSLLQN
jgi:acetate kinase